MDSFHSWAIRPISKLCLQYTPVSHTDGLRERESEREERKEKKRNETANTCYQDEWSNLERDHWDLWRYFLCCTFSELKRKWVPTHYWVESNDVPSANLFRRSDPPPHTPLFHLLLLLLHFYCESSLHFLSPLSFLYFSYSSSSSSFNQ